MTGNNLSKAEPWLQTANNDLNGARLLRGGRFWSLTCFMAQQAAEKAVKGYLRVCGETAYTSHGLTGLCHRCIAHDPAFDQIMDACRRLGRHYIPTRYPDAMGGDPPQEHYLESDADEALADATQVIEMVEWKVEGLKTASQETPQQSLDQTSSPPSS